MADRRRIITRSGGGRPIPEIDLEISPTYMALAGTFKYTLGQQNTQTSSEPTRYGGSKVVGEQNDNGTVTWQALVAGATEDLAAANIEALLGAANNAGRGRLLEWRPDGMTFSSYFRIAGAGSWDTEYKWSQWQGVKSMVVTVTFPVRPLVLWDRMTTGDPFDVDSSSDYTFDGATSADIAITGGVLTPFAGATLATERRARHTIRGYQLLEGQATAKFTPGSTLSGFKGGVILRGSAPNTYVEIYVTDNGTTSSLKTDVIIGGARTARATTNLAARISNGTPFWVRGRIEGQIVYAEHFTSAPNPTGAPTTQAPTGGAGYTLSGGEQTSLIAGYAGWSWVPQQSAATVDDFALQPYVRFNASFPQAINWSDAVPGTAPALADVNVSSPAGGAFNAEFALIAWAKRVGSPAAGYSSPMTILEGEAATTLGLWASSAQANAHGGNDVRANMNTVSSPGFAIWKIDASCLEADDFADGMIDLEVWARVVIASGESDGMRYVASLLPDTTATIDESATGVFAHEYGEDGTLALPPASGTSYRLTRLGVLTADQDGKLRLKVAGMVPGSGSGVAGLDYAFCVPARRRAATPTSIENAEYPIFAVAPEAITKAVRSDLSARATDTSGVSFFVPGLGGALIQPTPGAITTLLAFSSEAPNNPGVISVGGNTETASSYALTVSLDITPRSRMLRSA